MSNMKRHYKTSARAPHSLYIRQRVARNRRRAIWVGLLYLLSIVALTGAACLPLFDHEYAPLRLTTFYKAFLPANWKIRYVSELIILINSALYALLMLTLVINLFRALGKLGWLCKKRGSKIYGYNRNVYAMEELGNIFSGSLTAIINVYLLVAVLCGALALTTFMYVLLGAAVVLRLVLGFCGSKTQYYDLIKGEIVEQKRMVGRIAPVVRNILQFAAIVGIIYFLDFVGLQKTVAGIASKNLSIAEDLEVFIPFIAQVLAILCLFVLVKHATGIAEYNIDGPHGRGMKNFKIFSFLIFLLMGGTLVYKYLMIEQRLDVNVLMVAVIALAIFVVEMVMIGMPRIRQEEERELSEDEEEFYITDLPLRPQETIAETGTNERIIEVNRWRFGDE